MNELASDLAGTKHRKSKPRAPSCPNRVNMTFSNQRFLEIQKENQRLLNKLVKIRSDGDRRAVNGKQVLKEEKKRPGNDVDVKRQLEQMRIRNENISLVNRLLEVQPSDHLRADVLARDFKAQKSAMNMKRAVSANSSLNEKTFQ